MIMLVWRMVSGSSTRRPRRAAMTCLLSSIRSLVRSHRGDSGSQTMKMQTTRPKTIWKAMGRRQVKPGGPYVHPKSSQYAMRLPKAMMPPSMQMSRPRLVVLEHSAWYVGIVEVLTPFPKPVTVRPMINCAVALCPFIAVTWIMTPRIMTIAPRIIAFLRPKRSPKQRMKTAPKRHPIS